MTIKKLGLKQGFRMQMRDANMMREIQEALVKLGLHEFCVTNVSISPDWKYSNVYFTQNGHDEEDTSLSKLLQNRATQIGQMVKKRCHGHFFPKFRFIYDKNRAQSLRVDDILRSIEEAENPPSSDKVENLSEDL